MVKRRNSDEEINQFRISFTHRDANIAMQVAQHLSNDFIEQHIGSRITLSQKSLEFIDDELARLAERIREVEGRVAEVKNANPGRLPEDMTATQRRLERLMTDMAFAQRSLAEAVSDEAFYRSQINNAPVTVGEMTPENRLRSSGSADRGVQREGIHRQASRRRQDEIGDRNAQAGHRAR